MRPSCTKDLDQEEEELYQFSHVEVQRQLGIQLTLGSAQLQRVACTQKSAVPSSMTEQLQMAESSKC